MVHFSWAYLLEVIVPAIVAAIGALVIERLLSAKISDLGEKKKLPSTHVHAVKLIARWIIVIALILLEATIFGISVGRLWIVISSIAAMIIIGFVALWSILGNILAAIVLMIWRPFRIGDRITILPENISGQAKEINLFFTKLENEEGETISVPNTQIMQKFIKVRAEPLREDQ